MAATAELVVPKSIPTTFSLTTLKVKPFFLKVLEVNLGNGTRGKEA
jgi:hypothetical protein